MSAAKANETRPLDDESDEDASEAQAQVIASLRAQVTDLFSQVTQLNSKLVSSYDRVSDLEDQLHDSSSSLRNASLTISSLELERSHHLAALNTGLLVEKAHVTAELNRLMERATEEAAQRGQAESARHDIEKDLDDLSATLFDQANTMVAEARLGQARSERKVQDAEQALKIAEDAVKDMQVQMQVLHAEKEAAERDVQEAKVTMRKGKWVERYDLRVGEVPRIRLMTAHTPYAEFIAFVAHLKGLRASQPTPPVISTLLTQPFIARLLTEDSEPTVRLDLAPSLNWLSRRSVLVAIHTGMLTVEPLPFSSLVQELHQHPQSASNASLSCALCGTLIARLPSASPVSRTNSTNGNSWFKYPLALGSTQNHHAGAPQSPPCEPPGQVYVFRVAASATSTPPPALVPVHTSSVSVPGVGTSSRSPSFNAISPSRVLLEKPQNLPYPLCTSNYCMTRLRSTCSLWAFVRVGIVERVWEEGVVRSPQHLFNGDSKETPPPLTTTSAGSWSTASERPSVPSRRKRIWDMATVLGERAVSWGKDGGENAKEKEKEIAEKDNAKKLPISPPPHHHDEVPSSQADAPEPPPLPKRNIVRAKASTDPIVPSEDAQDEPASSEVKHSAVSANGHVDPDQVNSHGSGASTPLSFATPSSVTSPLPSTTSHPVNTEPNMPSIHDQLPPPSPRTIPLPMSPTPTPVSRVTSPAPRPRSQPSSPSSPPPNSRPASPAAVSNRSRAGSPTPTGIMRSASPSPPGQPPSIPHIRGRLSSPLASSRPASPAPAPGPGAPPLPRRAAARRTVPPPPTSGTTKVTGEIVKEDAVVVATAVDPTPEADAHQAGDSDSPTKAKNHGSEGGSDVAKEATVLEAAPVPADTPEVFKGSPKETVTGDVEEITNGMSASLPSDPPPPHASEPDRRMSMDTTSTKRSSTTEGEGFASDATWEERTWKELVRLKEDMFWARIGGIRGFQERSISLRL